MVFSKGVFRQFFQKVSKSSKSFKRFKKFLKVDLVDFSFSPLFKFQVVFSTNDFSISLL